jgi:hypothetical protein
MSRSLLGPAAQCVAPLSTRQDLKYRNGWSASSAKVETLPSSLTATG